MPPRDDDPDGADFLRGPWDSLRFALAQIPRWMLVGGVVAYALAWWSLLSAPTRPPAAPPAAPVPNEHDAVIAADRWFDAHRPAWGPASVGPVEATPLVQCFAPDAGAVICVGWDPAGEGVVRCRAARADEQRHRAAVICEPVARGSQRARP